MKRKLIAILVLTCVLLSMVVSCASNDAGGDQSNNASNGTSGTNDPGQTPDDSDPGSNEPPKKTAPELSGKTYDGQSYRVYVSGSGASSLNDFGEKNEKGYARVASAIYRRNESAETLYRITIEDTEKFGTSNGNGPGYQAVEKDFASGDCSHDLFMIGTLDSAQLAIGGYLYDFNKLPYIDLECDWWDQHCNDGLSIHGKMFYTTGDISVVDNIATHCVLFNKNVAKQNNVEDLYTMVKEGRWTYDVFLNYIKKVTDDVDGNDTMNEMDKYGLLTWNDVLQASMIGSGVRLATINENGEMELTLYNEKTVALVNTLTEVFNDGNYVYNYTTRNTTSTQSWQTYDQERDAMFSEDRCLFYGLTLNAVPRYRDSQTLDFGILPYPKYDENQEKYGSYVGASYSVMACVEGTIDDEMASFIGDVTEYIAYESMRTVTPEYYEQTLKGRYLKDEESWEMLDIIIGERIFDVGMYYMIPTANPLTRQITAIIAQRENGTFASRYESTAIAAQNHIDELNDMWFKFS